MLLVMRLLLVAALLFLTLRCCSGSLLRGLLLLLLVLVLRCRLSNGLLENLENFIVSDFLVRLVLGGIQCRWLSQTRNSVLGDS
jgi:hypothetical protein